MNDAGYLPGFLVLQSLLLGTHLILRLVSSAIRRYSTAEGTPRLALMLRVIGLILGGAAVTLGLVMFLVLITQPGLPVNGLTFFITTMVVAAYLLAIGGSLVITGALLRKEHARETAENATRFHYLMAEVTLFVSGLVCIATYFVPMAPFLFLPTLMAFAAMELFADVLIDWSQGQQQRYWNLWQIYLAVRSRRPLAEEIEFLSDYSWGRHRRRLKAVADQLRDGNDPSTVFIQPALMSRLEGAQIAVGLKSGQLPRVLGDLQRRRAEFLYNVLQSHNPIISVLYLWIVASALLSVIGFIMYWIIPKFRKIFDDFGTELPTATMWMIRLSDTFVQVWYLGAPLVMGCLFLLTGAAMLPLVSGHSGLREALSWLWPRICLPDILRTMAHAVDAKLPLEEAFAPLVRRQLRIPLHNRLIRAQEAVRNGGDCWDELRKHKLLTARESALLQSAERAGNLSWALETVSQKFERTWRYRLLFCFEFIQPALVIVVACGVGFFAIACFLPLVKLLNDLS